MASLGDTQLALIVIFQQILMKSKGSIFQQTYDDYLEMIGEIDLDSISHKLGAKYEGNKLKIILFNNEYTVSAEGISDSSGLRPPYDICVILCKYILLCPETQPNDHEWISYRNFKNSAPLVHYFKNKVEGAMSSLFSEKLSALQKASKSLAGYPPDLDVNYDFTIQFDALPVIPIILLFNNSDDEFPAKCSILFESQAEQFLDCECLAMLGRLLYNHLNKASK